VSFLLNDSLASRFSNVEEIIDNSHFRLSCMKNV